MKVVVLDFGNLSNKDLNIEALNALGDVTIYEHNPQTSKETIELIGDSQIVLSNYTIIDKEVIDACKNIKYIGLLSTGYNTVDVKYAKEKNIVVTNVPVYGSEIVGQFAIAMLLEICHRVGYHAEKVQEGEWSFWEYPLIELNNKTMGIVGYGNIGAVTANIARALGMKIISYTAHPKEGIEGVEFVSLDELYKRSDVISLHLPLFESTEKMINKESISKMKDGAILINVSRGGLVNEEDLADALNSGKLFAAGLDVVSKEPIEKVNPLLKAKNCIITPHMAWAAKEARQRLLDTAVDNVEKFYKGHLVNTVN
ncbi:D-2-hydroxyacid dehydrogenase [Peptoniphilus obesi]|uniref:D-2-hydroxyacid dehydrogenase n=1 Tax=Peptoniphilus obesi TaxID=1472765 RepID=UPI0004B72424|nr:D-2-hydroxyacid dehydrogenase [Peptoniphilus obesi]